MKSPPRSSSCFISSQPASESQPLTSSMFISPYASAKAATSLPTMFVISPDEDVMQVPVPAIVAETGKIPEGFSVDLILDPNTVIAALASKGIITTDHLSREQFEEIKAILNSPENVMIVPTSIYEEKRAVTLAALAATKWEVEHISEM